MDHFQNEIFVTTLTVGDEKSFQSHAMSENRLISKNPDLVENDRFPKTFVTEVYTNTERVAQTARKRGHRVGASMSLESGWNFLRPLDRKAARAVLKRESPFFLVLAFPSSFWSVLLNLNPPKNGTKMYEEAITLLQFALQLAKDQKSRGCHFVLENPQSSRAWTLEEMQRALEQLEARCVVFHQCRFRLKNQEAVSAYNSDINDAGVSPMQAAFGKQPRMHGDCLGDFGRRLSEHGLIDSRPSLARQVAMRETARLAMVRLHFSKGTSPFPEAVRAAFEQRRQSVSSAAPSASGESQASKRPAELDAERLREEALQPDPVAPTPAQPQDEVPDEASEALRVTHEVMEMEAYANVHPLRQIQIMAEQDRLNPLEARVRDHGTWRGNWPLPSRTEFKRRQMLKQLWPLGNDDAAQEVLAVLTARKEHVWSHMSDFEKKEFREAAAKGWSVWVENEAIEPLPDAEAARIRQKLKTEGEEFGPNERILYLANVKTRALVRTTPCNCWVPNLGLVPPPPYCGKKIEQAEDFSVKVSMEEYHSNLQQDSVPLLVVTDAKDAFDKSCSETPSYGSQKSLAFTISWIRSMLARCNTSMRWTATENMIVDCGTKELDPQHLHKILRDCKWCVQFSSQYVKQTSKSKKPMANSQQTGRVVRSDMGVPFESSSPLFGHVMKLSQSSGWHVLNEDLAVNVCRQARSYRTPEPRCSRTTHAFRSTFARFDSEHSVIWRQLEDSVDMRELQNPRSMLEEPVALLVTVFSRCPTPQMPQEKGMNCES
ncbi:unnamed protein product [Durusdinium trenchii]|uniref:Uncharacterized protein n=1 Tax=Durusdinium trenchii TaxID=1381693 RepID=A0ABP0HMR4_9DINO